MAGRDESSRPERGAVSNRQLAVETYNAAWSLLEVERDATGDRDLLGLAMTSRHHWAVVGGPQERAIADWMVSRCCAALGQGELAMSYAAAALGLVPPDPPAWLRASLHEGVARAASVAGDGPLREHHLGLAKAALADEADDKDRTAIAQQLDDVPPVRQRPPTAPDGGASPAEVR